MQLIAVKQLWIAPSQLKVGLGRGPASGGPSAQVMPAALVTQRPDGPLAAASRRLCSGCASQPSDICLCEMLHAAAQSGNQGSTWWAAALPADQARPQ